MSNPITRVTIEAFLDYVIWMLMLSRVYPEIVEGKYVPFWPTLALLRNNANSY
jgi:hypothetical protein